MQDRLCLDLGWEEGRRIGWLRGFKPIPVSGLVATLFLRWLKVGLAQAGLGDFCRSAQACKQKRQEHATKQQLAQQRVAQQPSAP